MINIPGIPLADVASQVASVLTAFWPLIALVAGVALGMWIFKKALAAFAGRR